MNLRMRPRGRTPCAVDTARTFLLRGLFAALLALLATLCPPAWAAGPDAATWRAWHDGIYGDAARVLQQLEATDTRDWTELDRVRLALLRAHALGELGRGDTTRPMLEALHEPVLRSGRPDLLARWEVAMGEAREGDDLAGARDHLARALRLAEQIGDLELQSLVHSISARIATEQHEIAAAAATVEADRRVAERSGQDRLVARNVYTDGLLQVALDDQARAEALFEDAARRFRRLGNVAWEADALRHLAQVRLEADRPAEALAPARRAVELLQTQDDPVFLALARGALAQALAGQGQRDEALAQSTQALALSEGVGSADLRALALLNHARVLQRCGQTEAAWRVLEVDLATARGRIGAGWELAYQRARAETLSAQRRAADAAAAWRNVLRLDRQRAARVLEDRLQAQDAVLRAQRLEGENALLQARNRDAERALAAEARARWIATAGAALLGVGVLAWLQSLRRVNRRVAHAAAHDGLTGLPNRRALLERTATLVDSRRRRERPIALVLVDVDHFKRVNDTHGHAVGDEVLREVATRLRQGLRDADLIARWGGEEFLLVLPATTLAQAEAIAERQRRAVAGRPVVLPTSAEPLVVTVSLGVSAIADGETTLDAALERADHALYRAKREGRDRVHATPPTPQPVAPAQAA